MTACVVEFLPGSYRCLLLVIAAAAPGARSAGAKPKPRLQRCGSCKNCLNPAAKKGCLRNKEEAEAVTQPAASKPAALPRLERGDFEQEAAGQSRGQAADGYSEGACCTANEPRRPHAPRMNHRNMPCG